MATFDELLATYTAAAERYRDGVVKELTLEDSRALVKYEAISRIMGTQNALTSKPHSASSAEAMVESDAQYWAHLTEKRQTVAKKMAAHAELEVARFRIQEALALKAALR